jgi:hypothetical protein
MKEAQDFSFQHRKVLQQLFRITGFLDFVSHPILNTRKQFCVKLGLFLPLGEKRKTRTLLGPLRSSNLND